MLEEKTIEDRLKNNDIATINKNKHTLTFPQLKAINILEKNSKEYTGGIHSVSGERFEILQQKESEASEADASDDILLRETPQDAHPVIYKSINYKKIKDATIKTAGAAGPSGLDADGWCHILISGNFGNVGEEFRKSIAKMAKSLLQGRSANYPATFLACKFIPLDKQQSVRPIGIV